LIDACAALGLAWDETVIQSDRGPAHEAAMDLLARKGRLYACRCSRSDRAASGRRAPDGGWAYDNICRARVIDKWRTCDEAVRARLDDDRIELVDELGVDLSQAPARDMGDPIVRRKDGVIAYQLAVVVDDHDGGITDVVRGRDIAPSTATQIMLQRLLGYDTPAYRHHFLLLEPAGEKLAKLHGSIPFSTLRYAGPELRALLARACGLPSDRVEDFDWARVRRDDLVARVVDGALVLG
jgi:glutamyl/glutaminyl-tRNA synthetase